MSAFYLTRTVTLGGVSAAHNGMAADLTSKRDFACMAQTCLAVSQLEKLSMWPLWPEILWNVQVQNHKVLMLGIEAAVPW